MKKNELKDMTVSELEVKLKDNLDSLQNFRFQKALQQLEDPSQIRNIKREIAQLNTVLREYDLGLRNKSDKKE
jgi:large subunit ribosomal protein L29